MEGRSAGDRGRVRTTHGRTTRGAVAQDVRLPRWLRERTHVRRGFSSPGVRPRRPGGPRAAVEPGRRRSLRADAGAAVERVDRPASVRGGVGGEDEGVDCPRAGPRGRPAAEGEAVTWWPCFGPVRSDGERLPWVSAMFGRSRAPLPLKRCSQCNAEMDADESVCPQCGHGLQDYAKRRRQSQAAPPQIDLTDLAQDWKVMTPAERRRVGRAGVLGTDQTIFARIAKRLGMVRRPSPRPARRVAARALVLAAVVGRASVEMNLRDTHSESSGPVSDQVLARLKRLGLTSELEPEERAFLSAPLGGVDPVLVTNAAARGEGLAVLAWALNRLALPPYDEPAFPPDRAQKSVGFENPDVARELLTSATLRPPAE